VYAYYVIGSIEFRPYQGKDDGLRALQVLMRNDCQRLFPWSRSSNILKKRMPAPLLGFLSYIEYADFAVKVSPFSVSVTGLIRWVMAP